MIHILFGYDYNDQSNHDIDYDDNYDDYDGHLDHDHQLDHV